MANIQHRQIESIDDPLLDELCKRLATLANALGGVDSWPAEQLELCGQYGVYRWFMPRSWHGLNWSPSECLRGYLRLSASCLTTTFVITQRTGACSRIVASENEPQKSRLLERLALGQSFATVGISHLTTSRRHLAKPVLRAEPSGNGFTLDGFSPWVTGAPFAENFVVGATQDDGLQILLVIPSELEGVEILPSQSLVALSASRTGPVEFHRVQISNDQLLAGPIENVMAKGVGAKTGGLQTSTLALGLSRAAIDFIETQVAERPELAENLSALDLQWQQTVDDLLAIAEGNQICSNEQLRTRSNSLALRCTQSALVAAKGAGFVADHPVGRWCQEALFFLVWSCPQTVLNANLCELAGIES